MRRSLAILLTGGPMLLGSLAVTGTAAAATAIFLLTFVAVATGLTLRPRRRR